MNRGLLRVFGIGAWVNSAWDFNYYFIQGHILSFLHTWLVFVTIFAIFFGYPIVGLFLIFAKMPFRMDVTPAQGLDDIETDLDTVLDIELET